MSKRIKLTFEEFVKHDEIMRRFNKRPLRERAIVLDNKRIRRILIKLKRQCPKDYFTQVDSEDGLTFSIPKKTRALRDKFYYLAQEIIVEDIIKNKEEVA